MKMMENLMSPSFSSTWLTQTSFHAHESSIQGVLHSSKMAKLSRKASSIRSLVDRRLGGCINSAKHLKVPGAVSSNFLTFNRNVLLLPTIFLRTCGTSEPPSTSSIREHRFWIIDPSTSNVL